MTAIDFRALCVELTDCLEKADWPHRYKVVFQQWTDIAHAALADDGEPASVVDQLKRQLFNKAKADLIRQVIDRALRDTASVHWRIGEGPEEGGQLVRVRDLMTWAEQTASDMENADGN